MEFRFIEREANSLLKEYSRQTGWKREPPVPVSLLAEILYDAIISFEQMDQDIAGELYIEEKLIRVNAADSLERQNFTIGHELGHLRLHVKSQDRQLSLFEEHPRRTIVCRRGDRRTTEREANVFAANLLMPQDLIIQAYKEIVEKIKGVGPWDGVWRDRLLSRKFEVSMEAMWYRLKDLKLIDGSGKSLTPSVESGLR